jgi:hypothetical protein
MAFATEPTGEDLQSLRRALTAPTINKLHEQEFRKAQRDYPPLAIPAAKAGLTMSSSLAVDGGGIVGADNDGFGKDRAVAVDMHIEHDLDDIAVLENGNVFGGEQGPRSGRRRC